MSEPVTYLRKDRTKRATGTVVHTYPDGTAKVKPTTPSWKMILLSSAEIQAGTEKGPAIARKQPANASEPKKRVKTAKPTPEPRWKQLHREANEFIKEHPKMSFEHLPRAAELLQALAAELEASQTMFSKP